MGSRDDSGGREAAVLARVLAREAAWLARAADDPAAAARAARGLTWLAELAQAFAAPRAAEYFTALRERPPREGANASAAWGSLGAPLCARLATEVKRARSLGAIGDAARDWDPHVDGVRAFEEPVPVSTAEPEAAPVALPAPEPAPDLAAPAEADSDPEPEPGPPTPAIYLAIAAFAGEREPRLTLLPGRVEIAGEHPPGALAPGALEALQGVASAEGAVLEVAVRDDGGLVWRVLVRTGEAPLPPPEPLQPPVVPADNPGDAVRPPGEFPAADAPRRALVADDSVMARVFLTRLLVQEGIAVDVADNGADARALLAAGGFDLVFLDVDMPGGGALEIARGLDPAARRNVCALVKDDDERARAEAEGLGPALLKPFAEDEVRATLNALRGASTDNP